MEKTLVKNSERKPLKALLASLVLPGLGQVYNGQLNRALVFYSVLAFAVPLFAWIAVHGPTKVLWISPFLAVTAVSATYLISMVDAYRSSKRIGANYQLRDYNRFPIYVGLLVFGYALIPCQLATYARSNYIEPYYMPSGSMLPTLVPGDRFYVDKRAISADRKDMVHRGDIAVFISPTDSKVTFAKRVIGISGDTVESRGTDVVVNGKSIQLKKMENSDDSLGQDHQEFEESADGKTYTVAWKKEADRKDFKITVPPNHVFLLGDNRDNSYDSRAWGPVPLNSVVGIAKQVWLSSEDWKIRWNRWGLVLN